VGSQNPRNEPTTERWSALAGLLLSALFLWLVTWLALAVLVPTLALGWQPHAIVSGSMEPTIRTGDVVLTRPADHPVDPGRVITFADPARPGVLITHRVIAVDEAGHYRTQGDANADEDSTPVPPDLVRGSGRLLVPLAGLPLLWASDQPLLFGAFVVAALAALLVVVGLPAVTPRVDAPGTDDTAGALADRPEDAEVPV
jgi:signal peptidase I